MKKRIFVTLAGILGAAMVLAGCTKTPQPISDLPMPSETKTEQTSFPGGLDDDGKGPDEGQFPGGLDDDGRGADEYAAFVDFQVMITSESAMQHAEITGYDEDNNEIWRYTTKEDGIGQCDELQKVFETPDQFIFAEFGDIVSLDKATGEERWRNTEFKGSGITVTTDYEGDTIYMCGYFGPDLFVLGLDGKTINIVNVEDDECFWPYELTWENEHAVKIKFESNDKEVTVDPLGEKLQ